MRKVRTTRKDTLTLCLRKHTCNNEEQQSDGIKQEGFDDQNNARKERAKDVIRIIINTCWNFDLEKCIVQLSITLIVALKTFLIKLRRTILIKYFLCHFMILKLQLVAVEDNFLNVSNKYSIYILNISIINNSKLIMTVC